MMITRRSFFAGPLVLASAAIHPTVADEPGQDDLVPRLVPLDFNADELHLVPGPMTWITVNPYLDPEYAARLKDLDA